ncbi:MAG: hypothetical protein ABIO19_14330 [Burkholderiaceae bacterium]
MFAMLPEYLKNICSCCQPDSKTLRYHQYVAIAYGPNQKEFSMNKLIATLIAATFAMGTAFAATPAAPATPATPAVATAPAATAPDAMPAPTKTVAKKSAHMKKAAHAKKMRHATKKTTRVPAAS